MVSVEKKGNPSLIVLAGATASGKTSLAITIAQRFDAEIVSADSLQVYRHLNIGTAKPTPQEMSLVRHHLIDCLEIDEEFSAARYVTLAKKAIAEIAARGKRIIVVGGAGLYIKALLGGLVEAPAGDVALRRSYKELAVRFGVPYLHSLLKENDPLAAQKIAPNDLPRLIRALETFAITGKSIFAIRYQHQFAKVDYPSLLLGIYLPREELFARIERRLEKMVEAGFVAEVDGILAQGYSPILKPLNSVGYKQIVAHLKGEMSLREAMQAIQRETKNYAKRQLNWFKSQQPLEWLPAADKMAFGVRAAEFWGKRKVHEAAKDLGLTISAIGISA